MNGKTAKLLRKVASKRGMGKSKKYIRKLKRAWYYLNAEQKTKTRKELQEEILS